MKKIIFCFIILLSVSAIAYAQEEIRIPGQHTAVGNIEVDDFFCEAYYYVDGSYYSISSTANVPDSVSINVVVNKNKVTVICKFIDDTTWHEANAEVAEIVDCHLIYGGCHYYNGTGHVTAAANHGDDPAEDGGNSTIECTFDNNPVYEP